MNNLSLLEHQLRSWTPRRPSDKIRAALERQQSKAGCDAGLALNPPHRSILNWVAPLAACAVAILLLAGMAGFHSAHSGGGGLFSAAPLKVSPLHFAVEERGMGPAFAFHSTDLNLEWNICSRASFEWTNTNQSPSSNDSLPLAKTNRLML
jgi:hypothetical protein